MKKVLVVVDMQNDFIDGALGTKEAELIVDNVVKKIAEFDGEIFVTLDTHYENYMETFEGKNLPVPHCIKNSNGWKINSRINEALADKEYESVEKITFGSVKLPSLIKNVIGEDYAEIELVGLCTDICVVSNALRLKAAFPEFTIVVDGNCCAGVTPGKHEAALETMRSCQIKVIGE